MNFFRFLFSKVFALNLLIALVLLAIGYYFLNNYLDSYTRHGEKVVVPDVQKMHVNQLDTLSFEGEFRFEVMDSIWERKLPKGIVLDQKPAPGDSVKRGRKIYVTINARSNKKIKLDLTNIVGATVRGALGNLESVDVVVDSVQYIDYEFDDYVLGMKSSRGKELENGASVNAGSKVILIAGRKSGSKIRTPKVLGLNLKEAQKALLVNNLNVSIRNIDPSCIGDLDSTAAFVVKQNPECSEEIRLGQEVSIFYSCDTTYQYSKECK